MAAHSKPTLARPHKIHMYQRVDPRKETSGATYRCVLPGCRHYLREEFIVGQIALCCICENEFQITKAIFHPRKIKKVHCPDCNRATYNRKLGRVVKKTELLSDATIDQVLDDLIKGE